MILRHLGRILLACVVVVASRAAAQYPFPVEASAQYPDGRIVVAGAQYGQQLALMRFFPDGSIDSTFGSGGNAQFGMPTYGSRVSALLLTPDDRIVVVAAADNKVVLARLDAYGQLDTTFGPELPGWVLDPLPGLRINAVVPEAGGFVGIGSYSGGPNTGMYVPSLVRYTASGARDTAFGDQGIRSLDVPVEGEWRTLVPMSAGGYMALGAASYDGGRVGGWLLLGRVLADWTLDPAFGNAGWNQLQAAAVDNVRAGIPDGGGNVLAVGSTTYTGSESVSAFAIYRIAPSGQLLQYAERTFSTPGPTHAYPAKAGAQWIGRLPNGDFLVGGTVGDGYYYGRSYFGFVTLGGGESFYGPVTDASADSLSTAYLAGEQVLALGSRGQYPPFVRMERLFHSPMVFDRDSFWTYPYAPFDVEANDFSIAPVVGAATGEVRTSAPFRITGITNPVSIRAEGGTYSIGCAEPFTADAGTVSNGALVCMRLTASPTAGEPASATLFVGEGFGYPKQASFVVTTVGPPQTVFGPAFNAGDPAVPPDPSGSTVMFFFSGDTASGPIVDYQCRIDGGEWASCGPSWYPYPHQQVSGLAAGPHTFEVRAANSYGYDATPAAFTWRVESLPEITITSGPAINSYSNVPSGSISFASPNSTQFECQLDNAAWATCTSPVAYGPFADGTHRFQVRGTNIAGTSWPVLTQWTVDTVPPDTTITAGPPALTASATATFTFTSDGTASYQCSLDGASWAACPGEGFVVAAGSHTLAVRAVDLAGNPDPTPATWTWVYESTPPDTTILSGPSGPVATRDAAFTYSSDFAGSTFECSLSGPGQSGAFVGCASSGVAYAGLVDGGYTFQVRARSPAGNLDPTPATRSFVLDAPAPDTTIVSGPGDVTWETTATFVLGSDQSGVAFECSLDGAAFGACPPQWQGYTGLAEGSHTFQGRAVFAGEPDPTPATRTWIIDRTPPQTTILATPANPSASSSATFEFGSSEAPSWFYCRLDGNLVGNSIADLCVSPITLTGLANGAHTFAVQAHDQAPNQDPTPATFTWTVDLSLLDTNLTGGPTGSVAVATATFAFESPVAGATFECSLDNEAFAACSSPRSYGSLADGPHSFAVRARNSAGDVDSTPATRAWTVDTSAPDTSITSGPSGTVGQSTVAFTFTSTDASALFECSLDGGAWAACSSGAAVPGLSEGMHLFEVRAVDAVGNVDATPASRTWAVDTTFPNTTITSGPPVVTSNTTATLAFSATESATFMCRLDGAAYGNCTSPVTLAALPTGSHVFSVYSIDAAGNADGSPATWSWVIDTTAPDTTITSAPGGTVTTRSATVAFSSTEGDAAYECSVDGAAFAACASPTSLSGLADGAHTFAVRARDAAGNVDASPATASWIVDATAPDTTITASPPAATNATTASFSFASTEPGSTFECKLDAGAFAACASPQAYSGLGQGSHTFAARARDAAGNQDASAATFTWTVDTTPPDTTITSGPSGNNNVNPVTFAFTATEPGSVFECRMDAGAWGACSSPKTYTGLAKGQHTFNVRARDAAGNVDATPAARSFGVK